MSKPAEEVQHLGSDLDRDSEDEDFHDAVEDMLQASAADKNLHALNSLRIAEEEENKSSERTTADSEPSHQHHLVDMADASPSRNYPECQILTCDESLEAMRNSVNMESAESKHSVTSDTDSEQTETSELNSESGDAGEPGDGEDDHDAEGDHAVGGDHGAGNDHDAGGDHDMGDDHGARGDHDIRDDHDAGDDHDEDEDQLLDARRCREEKLSPDEITVCASLRGSYR